MKPGCRVLLKVGPKTHYCLESIEIPMFAIKRPVDRKMHGEVTAGYIISDVECLRTSVQQIAECLLRTVKA